jgi:DNA-binding NarL/FixJ family response regulator
VSRARTLAEARSRIRGLADGVVLLDYHLGDECGLELMETVDTLDPRPAVVVVSGSSDPGEIVAALRAGADAWVLKSEGADALLAAVHDARNRVMTLPRQALRDVVRRFVAESSEQPHEPSFLDDLSQRELEVLRLLVAGLPRDRIAERLVISPHTVRTHVQRLHRRAGVHSTVALVARAREAGLRS